MNLGRSLSPLALALLAFGGSARAQQPSPSPSPPLRVPVFPGGVEQVVVDVVVADGQGRAVTGLSANDFTLTEDAATREILSFEAVAAEEAGAPPGTSQARLTRAFGIVFDDIHLTPAAGERVKAALADVLRTVLRDSDEVALLRTSSPQAWAGRVGQDRAALLGALDRLHGLRPRPKTCEMSDEEAKQIHVEHDAGIRRLVFDRFVKCRLLIAPPVPLVEGAASGSAAPPPILGGEGQLETWAADQHQGNMARIRSTYRTLEGLLRALSPLRGRKSVILASEGFVRDRGMSEVKGVVTAASDANAAVYFLDARELTPRALTRPADAPMGADVAELGRLNEGLFFGAEAAELLAEDTGGTIIRGSDLGQGLRRLADESRSYYLLGYAPRDPDLNGRFRAIKVHVRRPGLSVRARRGYYAVRRAGPPPANVAVTVPSVPRPPAAAPVSETIAAYAGGVDAARAHVQGWSAGQVDKAVSALKSSNAADDVMETAALAHAAAALAGTDPQEHQARAAAQAAALVRDAARRSALERRVLLGLAHRFLDSHRWEVAQDLARQATEQLADDADALLALGIVQETTGSVVDGGRRPRPDQTVLTAGLDEMVSRNPVTGFAAGVPGGPAGRAPEFRSSTSRQGAASAETRLRRAAETYRRALKARPERVEARLRLGRTLALLGETKPAVQELQQAASGGDAELAYLARLFLGDLQEQQGDFTGAVSEYRAALAARPGSAVARLAIARAQQASGDRAGAQAAVQALLLEPAADEPGDPWWRYRLRPLGRWAGELADLQ